MSEGHGSLSFMGKGTESRESRANLSVGGTSRLCFGFRGIWSLLVGVEGSVQTLRGQHSFCFVLIILYSL